MNPPFEWLNPTKALIVRIVHRDNVPGILDGGIPCFEYLHAIIRLRGHRRSEPDLQARSPKRADRPRRDACGLRAVLFHSVLGHAVQHLHRAGVRRRSNDEIVMLVTDLHHVAASGLKVLFTDAHAYTGLVNVYDDLAELHRIDWRSLQRRDFRRDPEDPRRMDRYLAEALVHEHVPVNAIRGIVCHDPLLQNSLQVEVERRGLDLPVHLLQWWYFR